MDTNSTPTKLSEILDNYTSHVKGGYAYNSTTLNRSQAEQAILKLISEDVEKHLNWWKEDIANGFIPKCSFCGRKTAKVVGQLVKGKHAQEHNSLPRNWMYYCQRCYDEGTERENEAIYG